MTLKLPVLPCSVCTQPVPQGWRLRGDDRFCVLCGRQAHYLASDKEVPGRDERDREVWLYWQEGKGLALVLAWERRQTDGRQLKRDRPDIDLARSAAYFGGDPVGRLTFSLREKTIDRQPPDILIAELVPPPGAVERLRALPAEGIDGRVELFCAAGPETWRARLLPHPPTPVLDVRCTDASLKQGKDGLEIYQKAQTLFVPMQIVSAVALCIPAFKSGDEEIALEGFDAAVFLQPHQPYPFRLRVNSTSWSTGTPHSYRFALRAFGLRALPLEGKIVLVPGSRLDFGGPNLQMLRELRLGEVVSAGFALTSAADAGAASEPIQVSHVTVHSGQDDGAWLRVVKPAPEDLPVTVYPPQEQPAYQLILDVDTSRLDRERYNGATLQARIELRDTRQRRWLCEVHAPVRRAQPLEHPLAFDWGTTHSCAAYRGRMEEPPISVLLDSRRKDPETFPSDIYFKDLGNPDDPVYLVGPDAVLWGQGHPECCLRSVKRKFQRGDELFVMDEEGRRRVYPVEKVAALLLHRLVSLAEVNQGWEARSLGFTFPTKWRPAARRRLQAVLEDLNARLQRERKPYRVEVARPEIDEATAVAINELVSGRLQGDRVHVIAYDFGGGTIDTCLLEVSFSEDSIAPATRYLGIGGLSDFGGDEVTRAVMMLLHDRLLHALKRRDLVLDAKKGTKGQLIDIPLVADGAPWRSSSGESLASHRAGRQSWDTLWKIGEQIKVDLCNLQGSENSKTTPARIIKERLQGGLRKVLCALRAEDRAGTSPTAEPHLVDLDRLLLNLPDSDKVYAELGFTLDDACAHPLEDVDHSNHGASFQVEQRVRDTVLELQAQCKEAGVEPACIVLAGGGCRLPLVKKLLEEHFPAKDGRSLLCGSRDFAKRQVAHGMANYLALQQAMEFGRLLARSVSVLHRPLGLQQPMRKDGVFRVGFRALVRVGTPIEENDAWHSFTFARAQIRAAPGTPPQLALFYQDWRRGEAPFGYFDLARPLANGAGSAAEPLPLLDTETYQAALCLDGVQRIQLQVTVGGRTYGPYPLIATVDDPEVVLLG